jgi:hypothetical protein
VTSAGTLPPRVVVVARRTEYEELLARHGTRGAAGYFLAQRGRDLGEVARRHEAQRDALAVVGAAVPADWRRGRVDRQDLPRFLFGPEDVVVAVGQDGLVANVAKYLDGQPVVGVDPEPGRNAGVLVRHRAGRALPQVLRAVVAGAAAVENRTMVAAALDDGQVLTGLNEIYLGHPRHQSARYVITMPDGRTERQSSSGVLIGTGTGATGWCASVAHDRRAPGMPVPGPTEAALGWFVREAWPSPSTGVDLTGGRLEVGQSLELVSEGEQLVVFADGLEDDRIRLDFGQRVGITVSPDRLNLVLPD